jgi:hypothetical protein
MYSNRGSLSETDLSLLIGDPILLQMMRNRRLVKVADSYDPSWEELTMGIKGLYHIRKLDPHKIFQVWFELEEDLSVFEKNLFTQKLSA